ncbi:MAG: 2-hydroxyglutaryl-CoA dehydratase [Acidobacteria bacterium]|nr:2-hydroxyglutaryl-CoA dehydratase [Acidobacteriota bacterium]MBI3655211.1 2-hydroxyglutaryl-CoA dehydratase [Acidobacteriota bacterium]
MQVVAGIDAGSGLTKAILINQDRQVLGKAITKTGAGLEAAAAAVLEKALEQSGLRRGDVSYIATTGLGRYSIRFRDIQITEITSGAKGACFLFPSTRCVLDIGSQSTRAVRVRETGKVIEFKTNDKCAAGSGSFLERAAKYLQIKLEDIGEMSLHASNPQPISSVCAVLAESEIINHISAGVSIEDMLRGIHDSLSERSTSLLKRVAMEREVTFIGGVAKQHGMVKALEERLQFKVNVPDECEFVCSLGAALLGLQRFQKLSEGVGQNERDN